MTNAQIIPLSKRPDLAETCAAWSFGEWGCYISGSNIKASIKEYKKRAQNQTEINLTWVSLCDEKITGMISLTKEDHPDIKNLTPWLASMFVHPEFRRNGYASDLIQHLHKEAKKLKYNHLYLFTPDAMKLYEKNGWKVTGEVSDPRGFRAHEKLMEIEL